ncbi:hypothetical protein [Oryzomicrobium sp.]|uniref:hypothetical protein n=1 Tax=Oryzomicrobium sp. TaxID=1911578 RepID=UPI002600A8E9|nr:hypothetical protein [Oryzomicrobium sp.]MCE1241700.1 hypothetical protein [Oryzomicrobium sp.]
MSKKGKSRISVMAAPETNSRMVSTPCRRATRVPVDQRTQQAGTGNDVLEVISQRAPQHAPDTAGSLEINRRDAPRDQRKMMQHQVTDDGKHHTDLPGQGRTDFDDILERR